MLYGRADVQAVEAEKLVCGECLGKTELGKLLSLTGVLHSENPLQVEDEWIEQYHLIIIAVLTMNHPMS
ncbi:MAG: hypothetical protein ACLTKI_06560 [Lachnospiraceae bacterium]